MDRYVVIHLGYPNDPWGLVDINLKRLVCTSMTRDDLDTISAMKNEEILKYSKAGWPTSEGRF